MTLSLTRRLARILSRPIDESTRKRAALHVLDWVGCAVAGSAERTGRVLAHHASSLSDGSISVIGARPLASPQDAAFLNGGLGNILEMDDIHRTAILHPGPIVVPAALAAAEARDETGNALLDAVVRGYDADIRLGTSVGSGHYAKWHNTSTCGPFGSAAAVASLLDLDEDALVSALGNAATQASGPWRCRHERVMTKQLHTANATRSGYVAASLAAVGFTGPEFILEGEQGFFDAMCPDPSPEKVISDPDGAWKLWETSFKPWPACRHAHPSIDAALVLRDDVGPDTISSIQIDTYQDAQAFCDRPRPTTPLEAKFSLQHAVALTILDGPPPLAGFEAAAIERPDVNALRELSTVSASDTYTGAYPEHYGSAVSVTLRDGSTRRASVTDALGDPENPLSESQVVAKAQALMVAGGVSERIIDQIIAACLALPQSRSVKDLTAGLQRIPTQNFRDIAT